MKTLGYGKGYRYDHDEKEDVLSGQKYFPDEMERPTFYEPVEARARAEIEKADGLFQ